MSYMSNHPIKNMLCVGMLSVGGASAANAAQVFSAFSSTEEKPLLFEEPITKIPEINQPKNSAIIESPASSNSKSFNSKVITAPVRTQQSNQIASPSTSVEQSKQVINSSLSVEQAKQKLLMMEQEKEKALQAKMQAELDIIKREQAAKQLKDDLEKAIRAEKKEAERQERLARQKAREEEKARKAAEWQAYLDAQQKAREEAKLKKENERLARIKAEEERQAQLKAEAERKAEEKRKADEARQAQLKAEAERKAEEKRKAEEARQSQLAAEKEAKRKAEEERQAQLKAEEERKAAEKRKAEEERQAQLKAEAERKIELKRKAEEERQAKLKAEEERQAAEKRKAEEERQAQLKAEEDRKAAEKRKADEERQAQLKLEVERKARQSEDAHQTQNSINNPILNAQITKGIDVERNAIVNTPSNGQKFIPVQNSINVVPKAPVKPVGVTALQRATSMFASNVTTGSPIRQQLIGYAASQDQIKAFQTRYKYESSRMAVLPKQIASITLNNVVKLNGDQLVMFKSLADKRLVEEYMAYHPLHAEVFSNYIKRIMTMHGGQTNGINIDQAMVQEITFDLSTLVVPSSTVADAPDQYLYITSRLNENDQAKFWNWVNAVKIGNKIDVPAWVKLVDVMYSH